MLDQERIAVLEANQERIQQDITKLFELIRKHMEKEEERWDDIHDVMVKWKGFVGGIIFITSAIWAVVLGGIHILGKLKGA